MDQAAQTGLIDAKERIGMSTNANPVGVPSGRTLRDARVRRHEQAVIQAEVRRLASAIRPFGVLNRQTLAHMAGAEHWREGGLPRALDAAVDAGVLEERAFGFYGLASHSNRVMRSRRADRVRSARGQPLDEASRCGPARSGSAGSTATG